jgi:lipoprotein-releasing system ATP-binding protein
MILSCNSIHQFYNQGEGRLEILKSVNFSLKAGEIVGLVGPSGSGKSTFLHIAGLLEQPSSGRIEIDGTEVCNYDANGILSKNNKSVNQLRLNYIGFIYQFHHLLSEFTALENVMLPLILSGVSKSKACKKATVALSKMGLSHRLTHLPNKLSGGEQQRVAIARALINDPKILLADEPTGNLDNDTAKMVFDELLHLIRDLKLGALIATHDLTLASKMDRVVRLSGGILEDITSHL